MKKNNISRITCFAAALLFAAGLRADSWQYSATTAGGASVDAIMMASPTSTAGQEDITDITGTVSYGGNTFAIIGLVPDPTYTHSTTPDGSYYFDNVLYTSGPAYFDIDGVAFTISNGNYVNIFNNPPETFSAGLNTNYNPFGDPITSESLSGVPEPATLLLMPGAGALLLFASKLRKKVAQ